MNKRLPLHQPRRALSGGTGSFRVHLLEAFPFVASAFTIKGYAHRPRTMAVAWFDPNEHDIAHIKKLGISQKHIDQRVAEGRRLIAHFWCGGQAHRAIQLDSPGVRPLCATCEGRAVAVGLPSAEQLTTFRPQTESYQPEKELK